MTNASTEATKILHREASVAVVIAAKRAAVLEARLTKNLLKIAATRTGSGILYYV